MVDFFWRKQRGIENEISAYLKEAEVSSESLPEGIRGAVVKMRSDVDSLTTAMIREGVVQGKMEAVFTGNLGTYMRRTYRIFRTDPKKVPKFINKLTPELSHRRGLIAVLSYSDSTILISTSRPSLS